LSNINLYSRYALPCAHTTYALPWAKPVDTVRGYFFV